MDVRKCYQRYYLSEKLKAYCLSPGTKKFMHTDAKIDLPIARALLSTMGNSHRSSVNNYVTTNGRVRALTMREVHRLMGYPDNYNIVVSKAQAYKQAGNSIVVDVMMNIQKQILMQYLIFLILNLSLFILLLLRKQLTNHVEIIDL